MGGLEDLRRIRERCIDPGEHLNANQRKCMEDFRDVLLPGHPQKVGLARE
jgi:hypothetical protein